MKNFLIFFLLSVICSAATPVPGHVPVGSIFGISLKAPESKASDAIHDNFMHAVTGVINRTDTENIPVAWTVNITDFGAKVDGKTDDFKADSAACAYCIANPKRCTAVVFPVGHSRITKPLLLQNNGQFFTVRLMGLHPAKSASNAYLSAIDCDFKAGYGIGIQLGRGVVIENLSIFGKYVFPYSVSNLNIGTLKFSDWIDSSIADSRYAPYAGISIDPNFSKNGSIGGSSDVTIQNCAIKQWMVGIMLTPNGNTANDEMINILEDNIELCRTAIAIGQDQSKTINIRGLKVWNSTYTVLDGLTYGSRTGGGSVFCDNWNIAGNVNQLFNITATRFPFSAMNIFAESLFRMGSVYGYAGVNFINLEINLLTGPGIPVPDYILYAGNCSVSWSGGCLRYYNGDPTTRMNLSNMNVTFRDITLSARPFTIGLSSATAPTPIFENVEMYYSGARINGAFPVGLVAIYTVPNVNIDRTNWVGNFICPPSVVSSLKHGNYIYGQPNSNPTSYASYDPSMSPHGVYTIQIGRITRIAGDSVYFDQVSLNASKGRALYNELVVDTLK